MPTVLERLKIELNNKQYYDDKTYNMFLEENTLSPTDTYDKSSMQKNLLLTVLAIFETVINDIDLMRSVETEFSNTSDAYKHLEQRIQNIKDRIASIPDTGDEYSVFSLMYTRK